MRMLPFILFATVLLAVPALSQTTIVSFDEPRPDTLYVLSSEGAATYLAMSVDSADKQEGAGSLNIRSAIGAFHPWGSFSQFQWISPDSSTQDFSISDSISIWIKVTMAPTHPEYMVFRLHLVDQLTKGDPQEDYIYENATILDATTDWVQLKIPFAERVSDGSTVPNAEGFVYAPTGWGGFTYNNKKLDRDKIVGWKIAMVTSGWTDPANIPADSLEIFLDGFERFGARAVPAILFNGKDLNNDLSAWAWGGASQTVELNAGTLPKTNALVWTQGAGWTGIGYDIAPAFNLAGAWHKDSVHFTMKVAAGVGELRMQFESGPPGAHDGKVGFKFTPTADNAWHDYVYALEDMVVMDNAPNFDSSAVVAIGLMAEGSGVAGLQVYVTNWWTGNPVFDVIAPDAPTNVQATGGGFTNLITWTPTPNEPDATYSVYFSESAFTTLEDSGVEDLRPLNQPAATVSVNHILRAPQTDQNITYYYGVVAKDAASNESPVAVGAPVTTMAKGVPTISLTVPTSFTADGDLAEWSAIDPIVVSKDLLTAHVAPNSAITNDGDGSMKAYIAMDATHLYVALDVTDDVVAVDTAATDYLQDAPDLFIGLYDHRGMRHSGLIHGATPDYHFRFSQNKVKIDNGGYTVMEQFPGGAVTNNPNYIWKAKDLEAGYVVEAKIAFADLVSLVPADSLFTPVEGMRIPIDLALNDRDNAATREGILCYSTLNDDNSYQDMWRWTYTWIGSLWTPTSVEKVDNVVRSYELGQNYPNPFNPTTAINYSIERSGMVTLRVYDLIGREVATLVNASQDAGSYLVTFNAASAGTALTSGVYFYRLESGSFVSVKKLVLLK